ncbi:MAG: neutral zinc metallopeptidase [Solirubrobacteraceae bacterium]|nr:neutral zinc metallopeptidase [Solirubrobacteraceae bacterium]
MKTRRTDDAGDMIDARGGGLGRRAGVGAGGLGLTGVLIVLALQLLSGGKFEVPDGFDPSTAITAGSAPAPSSADEDSLAQFSGRVAADVQDVWTDVFKQSGESYRRAKIVRYSQAVSTDGCGNATSAVGPFYCPGDERVYLDMSFYRDMRTQLGATGDFAWAYVIAHELGHHVQNLTGTFDEVRKLEQDDPSVARGAQGTSVRTELQADCYAGVWAHAAYGFGQLEKGDLQEAITAAEAVGDDRLQSRSGSVRPDTFTHGTSAQRQHWFQVGYDSGKPSDCDTFSPGEI